MTTKVINKTSGTLILKEGTQGVYRVIGKLNSGCHHDIKVDPNSTYREYWCAAKDNDPNYTVLSSDDCQDYRIIEIFCEEGTYFSVKKCPIKTTEASDSGGARKKAGAWLKAIFTGGAG